MGRMVQKPPLLGATSIQRYVEGGQSWLHYVPSIGLLGLDLSQQWTFITQSALLWSFPDSCVGALDSRFSLCSNPTGVGHLACSPH